MLLRSYQRGRSNILLWSGLCFIGLSINNIVLAVDMILLPQIDFNGTFWRSLLTAASGCLLLFGLIWEVA
jgi:hypothetical protein